MGIFSSRHSERKSELELALQGAIVLDSTHIKYSKCGKNKDENRDLSVNLLPVESYDGTTYGFFRLGEKVSEAPVGFVRNKLFLLKDHYHLSDNGGISTARNNNEILYLPLAPVPDVFEHLGKTVDSNFIPNEGSPFKILGLQEMGRPLVLVRETEEGISMRGLFLNGKLEVETYNFGEDKVRDRKIGEFLDTFWQGEYTSSEMRKRSLSANSADGARGAAREDGRIEIISNNEINWEKPTSIVEYLDKYVIGQKDAKRVVAVAFSNYMTRVNQKRDDLPKDNALLIGPSGVGKTYMISLLASRASLPFVQSKLTGKSSEGYKGENLSGFFGQLRAQTKGDKPYGVVFLDEIDKLAQDDWGGGTGFGPRLQNELIGWLEEATVLGEDTSKGGNPLNTRNILFVTAGAFRGLGESNSLENIILKRMHNGKGFNGLANEKGGTALLSRVRPEDLITYGLRPELVGRLPAVAVLGGLSTENKVKILKEAGRSPMLKYTQLLQLKGYDLRIDDKVNETIAKNCPEETGARALDAICSDLFTEILFEPHKYANEQKVIQVTPDLADQLINLYK